MIKNLHLKKYNTMFSYFTMYKHSHIFSSYPHIKVIAIFFYFFIIIFRSFNNFVIFDTLRSRFIRLLISWCLQSYDMQASFYVLVLFNVLSNLEIYENLCQYYNSFNFVIKKFEKKNDTKNVVQVRDAAHGPLVMTSLSLVDQC